MLVQIHLIQNKMQLVINKIRETEEEKHQPYMEYFLVPERGKGKELATEELRDYEPPISEDAPADMVAEMPSSSSYSTLDTLFDKLKQIEAKQDEMTKQHEETKKQYQEMDKKLSTIISLLNKTTAQKMSETPPNTTTDLPSFSQLSDIHLDNIDIGNLLAQATKNKEVKLLCYLMMIEKKEKKKKISC